MDLKRLDKIESFDEVSQIAKVQAGMIGQVLEEDLNARGYKRIRSLMHISDREPRLGGGQPGRRFPQMAAVGAFEADTVENFGGSAQRLRETQDVLHDSRRSSARNA